MEPEAKRGKRNNPSSGSKMEFLNQIDDCIFAIFHQLSPSDLCSMTFTCKRIQTLAFDYFQRKFSDRLFTVNSHRSARKDGNKLAFSDVNGKHVKYFSKCIPAIRLKGWIFGSQRIFNFIKTECCPTLAVLDISSAIRMDSAHGEIIADQLKNLKSLAIRRFHPKTEIHNMLLKYCTNLEHLTIESGEDFNIDWLQQHYSTLMSLGILLTGQRYSYRAKFIEHSEQFFQNNSQLKDITCLGGNIVRHILLNVSNIQRLVIITAYDDNFGEILDDLKIYCTQSPIKCLEFDLLIDSKLKYSAMLQDFNKIHPHTIIQGASVNLDVAGKSGVDMMPVIMDLKCLKKLKLHATYASHHNCRDLSGIPEMLVTKLLFLEELELDFFFPKDECNLKRFLTPFVRNAMRLRKLTIRCPRIYRVTISRNGAYKISKPNDWIDLNAIRSLVPGACYLNINIIEFSSNSNEPSVVPQLNVPTSRIVNIQFENIPLCF